MLPIKVDSNLLRLKDIIKHFKEKLLYFIIKQKIRVKYFFSKDIDIVALKAYLKSNRLNMIPHEFTKKYEADKVQIFFDNGRGYPYVIINEIRIYLPKEFSKHTIQKVVTSECMEQDDFSPHKYLTDGFNIQENDTAVIIGASTGIFASTIIEKISKMYLFEPNKIWTEPLRLTFLPWKNKVEIIPKFISNIDSENTISLDSFYKDKNENINYIQADIEGNEKNLLLGAKYILNCNNKLKLSICCYHNDKDEFELTRILSDCGFKVSFSKGYIVMPQRPSIKRPLRRGVIYAKK